MCSCCDKAGTVKVQVVKPSDSFPQMHNILAVVIAPKTSQDACTADNFRVIQIDLHVLLLVVDAMTYSFRAAHGDKILIKA